MHGGIPHKIKAIFMNIISTITFIHSCFSFCNSIFYCILRYCFYASLLIFSVHVSAIT